MRAVAFLPIAFLSAFVFALSACNSDPAAPEIDPGKETEEGGVSADGGIDGSTQTVDYPPGPYGYSTGAIVHDFKFSGLWNPQQVEYVADNTTLKPIAMHDLYNPSKDTSKPRVLLLTWSARWCSVCQVQAGGSSANGIPSAMSEWKVWNPKGAQFMEAIFEDANYKPSQPADLAAWTKKYAFEFPSVLDSDLQSSGVTFDRSAAPYNMVVDLSNMKITYAQAGLFTPSDAEAEFSLVLGE
jgi:hypothetical protein